MKLEDLHRLNTEFPVNAQRAANTIKMSIALEKKARLASMSRNGMTYGRGNWVTAESHLYAGTVPAAEVAKRRAKNKAARTARKVQRRHG